MSCVSLPCICKEERTDVQITFYINYGLLYCVAYLRPEVSLRCVFSDVGVTSRQVTHTQERGRETWLAYFHWEVYLAGRVEGLVVGSAYIPMILPPFQRTLAVHLAVLFAPKILVNSS